MKRLNPGVNSEQLEAEAVCIVKSFTDNIYVGLDIYDECISQMLNVNDEGHVFLEPVTGSTRRVIVALLKHIDDMSIISKRLLPYGYAIAQCLSNEQGEAGVKWYCLHE
tara:strand:- start:1463 stop:1789 length:327 start_codon:yes stop_codon:yes gene_type:complete